MNKFNLTMSVLVIGVIIFFGVGIVQKVNYAAADMDSVSISYSMTSEGEDYKMNNANFALGSDANKIFADELVLGQKVGTELEFELELTEDVALDQTGENTLTKGTTVTIKGKIEAITPYVEVESEVTSEAASEVASETVSE